MPIVLHRYRNSTGYDSELVLTHHSLQLVILRKKGFVSTAAMGLYQLLEGLLLLANAVAILNEDRFLVPMGLGIGDMSSGRGSPFKTQLIGFVHAAQYLRVPMVFANAVVIVSKLLFG